MISSQNPRNGRQSAPSLRPFHHNAILLFLIVVVITNITVHANSASSPSSTRARRLNSKIASLIKQSSLTISTYGGRPTPTSHSNVRSILSRVNYGGSSSALSVEPGTIASGNHNSTTNYHGYDNFNDTTVVLTTSVSTSTNATSSLNAEVHEENDTQEGNKADDANCAVEENKLEEKKKLKVLFLSADTGGGHRASAQSLAGQVRSQSKSIQKLYDDFDK